ncbi:MAG: hypothetical protein ACYDCN_05745 [Bacteroidia bacterium]
MITVVKESKTEYNVVKWQHSLKINSFDENIDSIENNHVLCYIPSGYTKDIVFEKPKKQLSTLRGRITKQSEKDIDNQISEIRKEWDRNI